MSNNDAVIEFLFNQLQQQQLTNNPYKQQCEDLAHEVQSLKNQLRDMSELVDELLGTITLMNGKSSRRKEDTQYNAWRPHYGARQPVPDGTMVFIRYRNGEEPKHSVAAEKRSWIWDGTYADIVEYQIDTQECEHDYRLVLWCSDLQQCSKCGVIK